MPYKLVSTMRPFTLSPPTSRTYSEMQKNCHCSYRQRRTILNLMSSSPPRPEKLGRSLTRQRKRTRRSPRVARRAPRRKKSLPQLTTSVALTSAWSRLCRLQH
eukprot:Rmarinus@m.17282